MTLETTPKKWFVYLGNHHEGPFSKEDIQAQRTQGTLSDHHFVWSEGMKDWILLRDVRELDEFFQSPHQGKRLEDKGQSLLTPKKNKDPVSLHQPFLSSQPPLQSKEQTPSSPLSGIYQREARMSASAAENFEGWVSAETRKAFGWLTGSLVSFFVFFSLSFWGLSSLSQRNELSPPLLKLRSSLEPGMWLLLRTFPILEKWLPPLPSLHPPLSLEDTQVFKKKLLLSGTSPWKSHLALVPHSMGSPTFYALVPLPYSEGRHLVWTLKAVGIPETLVDTISFEREERASWQRHLVSFPPLQAGEGKLFPLGEYDISLIVHRPWSTAFERRIRDLPGFQEGQETATVLTQRFFLGGAPDGSYKMALEHFHERFLAQSREEWGELKQFLKTFQELFQESFSTYQQHSLATRKEAALKKAVTSSSIELWTRLSQQVAQEWAQWTPEFLEKKRLHGDLYQQLKQTGEKLLHLRSLHQRGLQLASGDPEHQLIQEHSLLFQSVLSEWQLKVQEREASPFERVR